MPKYSKNDVRLQKEITYLNTDIDNLLANQMLMIKSEQMSLNPELELTIPVLSEAIQKNKTTIKKIVGNGKLFFYFDEHYCSLCYKEIIEKVNQYVNSQGSETINIIANFSNLRNFVFFLKNTEIKVPVYYISESVNIIATEANQPFFFVLDSDLKVRSCYIPDKKYNKNVEEYITSTSNYLKGNTSSH